MKRMISFLLPFLMAGGVFAQGGQQEDILIGEGQQQGMVNEYQGIPLFQGAQQGDQPGQFEVQQPLDTVKQDYKQQLESEGYTVNELSSEEGRTVWEIQKEDTRANVTLEEAQEGTSKIVIEPQSGGGMMME